MKQRKAYTMKQVVVIALCLFILVIATNGLRLTFNPNGTCNTIPFAIPDLPNHGRSIITYHD